MDEFCTRFLRLLILALVKREREPADFHLLARKTGMIEMASFWLDASWQHPGTLYFSNLLLSSTGHDQCFPGQPALGLSYRFPVALL